MATTPDSAVRTRGLAEQAISAALEAEWAKAVELNSAILKTTPDDVEARNRLGRALLEQGKLEEARTAFGEVLKAFPNDPIALRNNARVTALIDNKVKVVAPKTRTQVRLFIEDMGKTGILRLINPAPLQVLAKYSPGAEAELREQEGLVAVHARDGELLGFLEPKVGRRLLDLLRTGNQYVVALVSNDHQNPRVAIREIVQSPENAHRISFPGHHRPMDSKERAYIKGTFFRFGEDEEGGDEMAEAEEPEETIAEAVEDAAEASEEEPLLAEEEDEGEDEDEEE
ncbi:MAG TPA: tetratricopeptide repeat protein [Candidatus Limnocylindria bacterium]|nr:tetratricopeptide repeat protein [Candidatus Limnocylindria bacterium]